MSSHTLTMLPLWNELSAWFASLPRALAMFALLPMFRKELLPQLLRIGLVAGLCLPLVPLLKTQAVLMFNDIGWLLLMIAKEIVIGFALGLPLALTFWIAEGIGTLLDNQSGSLISAVLNPMSGNESATLGMFLQQAFLIYFLMAGGLLWCIGGLYDSYQLWPINSFWPQFAQVGGQWWLQQFSRYIELVLVLAAPIILALFCIEIGFGMIGRFAPKMQVFVLAMPIKNVIALLLLLVYFSVLLTQFDGLLSHLTHSIEQTFKAIQ